ncbi:flagellar filament capping protein FliD [Pseudodesulfovibrio sediminis]|uniref:Flagellar hook-associated protein 2 n=1 Tax=Pseudodesulfovibrio sediminis TaxID=2810563 RepID=A0ABM7PA56_9BACT|nr:flagellar filament capping protein FliD [Pseudodesulfovibrio sediminis]BCS90302.1 flagellar hook-associated protein 2 [Pseudodesulfovibrio sediminis]
MSDSTYTSGAINFAGLGNGTDFNSLIDGLVKVEQNRVVRLENWKASWELKNEYFKELNTQMLTLKTTLQNYDSVNEFMTKAVSSSNTDLVLATGNAKAQEASHTLEIGQLATNDVLITTSGANSLTSSVTSADTSFTFSYGGTSYTLNDIAAGTTLEGFVHIINNHPDSKEHIRASTIFDGSVYHLQINGMDQGADNQVVISNAGSIIFGSGDFTETQNAQNSQVRVNGFPASNAGWIERSSNTVDDVIEGLTLNLKDASPGETVSLTITTDQQSMQDNVTSIVQAINMVRAQVIAMTKVNDEGEGAVLTGNYGVDMVSQKLKNITAEIGLGFKPYDQDTLLGDKYASLSQLGILTDAEDGSPTYGLLTIDYEKLAEAISDDPTGVAELFSAQAIGESASPDFTYKSSIEGTTKAGLYEVEIVSDGTQITSATINGEEASISGWEITGLTGEATGMAIRLDNTTAGTHSGEISIKTGKTGEMIDELSELTKPYSEITHEGGPLAVLQDNYRDIMDSIDTKIKYEEKRIEKMEQNLRLKFARLDALLGQYQLTQGQLDSSIAQLSS